MSGTTTTDDLDYQPFPNEDGRNARQAHLEVPIFVRALGIHRGARILEIGCGRGIALPVISRLCRPSRLVGVDIDETLLTEAAATTAGLDVELVCADVRALPFPDETFDVVIDFGTCYHISRPANAIGEITRVLTPGGSFCHETPLMQMLSHPARWHGRLLPWAAVPQLLSGRQALLWSSRHREPHHDVLAPHASRGFPRGPRRGWGHRTLPPARHRPADPLTSR